MKCIFIIISNCFYFSTCFAQQTIIIANKNSDCANAIQIIDSVITSKNSPEGSGNILEISGNSKTDTLFFEQEHHTVWYWFKAKHTGELSFEIIPQSINDDYDFALYKFTDENFCNDVKSKNVLPIRTCISRNDKSIKSITGLKENASKEFIHSGKGESFTKSISVTENEVYFLLVDNVNANGKGHTIKLHYKYSLKSKGQYTIGESIIFENIGFEEGTAKFSRNAYGWLDSLLRIMIHHPTLKIEIQGHVDGFNHAYDSLYQQVSQERAKAVFDFLVKNKIDATRMIYNGYGNTKMMFRYPDFNQIEHRMNRRVEIKILSI